MTINQPIKLNFRMVNTSGAGVAGTPTCKVSIDGGSFTACTNAPVAISGLAGAWSIVLTAAETNAASICFTASLAGAVDVFMPLYPEADMASRVWSATTRTLTGSGILPKDSAAVESFGGDTLHLVQRSSRLYRVTVPGIPVGQTVTKGHFMVKASDADTDAQALLAKEITTTQSASGQVVDAGANGTAVLEFLIDNDDLDALPTDTMMRSAVKVILSGGGAYTPLASFRPVLLHPPGVQATM